MLDMLAALRTAAPDIEPELLLLGDGPLREEATRLGVNSRVLSMPESWRAVGESDGLSRFVRNLPDLPRGAPAYLASLRAVIEDVQPDIVHTNGMKAHLLCGVAAPRRVPLVVHLHDFPSHRPLTRHALRFAASRPVHFIAVSNAVARDCETSVPGARVTVMHNAVDTDYFCPGAQEAEWLAGAAGLVSSVGQVAFGLVATYARWKGQDVFLRAAARVVAQKPAFLPRFYIVGGPIYDTRGTQFEREELERLALELGVREHVGFAPFMHDVAKAYRALDVVVHASSQREAFGRTIVEAMACERAVIVSAGGGARELFREGVSALGFAPGDVSGLAAAMLRLGRNRDEAQRLAREARKFAVVRFDRRRLGAELGAIYARALGGA